MKDEVRSMNTGRSMEAFALLREELKRERQLKAELLVALQAVVAIADRKTVEFDAARAAIAKAL